MKRSITFLCTTGGGPGILTQVSALKSSAKYDARVILADANAASGNLFLPEIDARYVIPSCASPDFIPALVRMIEAEKIDYLYSGLDEEMPVIAENRATLEAAGCKVLLPPAETLLAALDKGETRRWLDGVVRMPEARLLTDALYAGALYDAFGGCVVLKATTTRGGRNVFMPEDRDEFEFLVERARRWQADKGERFKIERWVDGDEFNVTTLHDLDGREIYAFSRRKFENRKVKSTTTAACIEKRDDVISMARTVIDTMGLKPGFNNVEIIVSHDDDQPYFIEINGGRTAAQDMNVVASGVNVTDLMIDILEGETVAPLPHIADGLAILKIRTDVLVPYADIEALPRP